MGKGKVSEECQRVSGRGEGETARGFDSLRETLAGGDAGPGPPNRNRVKSMTLPSSSSKKREMSLEIVCTVSEVLRVRIAMN